MKEFEITTKTKYCKHIFLTKAKNGKLALRNLMTHSSDFKSIEDWDDEADIMKITIKRQKTDE